MEIEKITVKYQTQKEFCHCCERDLDEVEIGKMREFDFLVNSLKEDVEWSLYDEYSELEEVVREYVCETVEFFAVDSYDRLLLPKDESDKILSYVKKHLI